MYKDNETLLKTIKQDIYKVEIFIGTNKENGTYFVSYFSENNILIQSIEQKTTWTKHFKLAKWVLRREII
tara:strand:+ start:338 stop:547 length:210 start_codon:yes stop_codon:yes gene_type:complete